MIKGTQMDVFQMQNSYLKETTEQNLDTIDKRYNGALLSNFSFAGMRNYNPGVMSANSQSDCKLFLPARTRTTRTAMVNTRKEKLTQEGQ